MSLHRFICVNSHVHVHSINQEMYMERISVKTPNLFSNLSCQTRGVAYMSVWHITRCLQCTFDHYHFSVFPCNLPSSKPWFVQVPKKDVWTNVQSWSLGFVLHTAYFYNAILLLWKWTKTNCELVIHIQVCSPGHTWNNPTDAWQFILNSHWYLCCNDWP